MGSEVCLTKNTSLLSLELVTGGHTMNGLLQSLLFQMGSHSIKRTYGIKRKEKLYRRLIEKANHAADIIMRDQGRIFNQIQNTTTSKLSLKNIIIINIVQQICVCVCMKS